MKSFGKKAWIMLILLVLLGFSQANAQGYLNRHPFDFKKFNLGFVMGFNYNSYNLKEQINITEMTPEGPKTLVNIDLESKPGLNIGMITNFNIAKQHSLRLIPTISLEQRDFIFNFDDNSSELKKIEASYLNLPLVWQYKTGYYRATRVYVLFGGQWGANLASNRRVRDNDDLLKIDRQDVSLVFGFGFNLYGERLKLSPEIVYTMGVLNIYSPEETAFAQGISSLHSQVLSINVNFE